VACKDYTVARLDVAGEVQVAFGKHSKPEQVTLVARPCSLVGNGWQPGMPHFLLGILVPRYDEVEKRSLRSQVVAGILD